MTKNVANHIAPKLDYTLKKADCLNDFRQDGREQEGPAEGAEARGDVHGGWPGFRPARTAPVLQHSSLQQVGMVDGQHF